MLLSREQQRLRNLKNEARSGLKPFRQSRSAVARYGLLFTFFLLISIAFFFTGAFSMVTEGLQQQVAQTLQLSRMNLEERLDSYLRKDKVTGKNPKKVLAKLKKKLRLFRGKIKSDSLIVDGFRVVNSASQTVLYFPEKYGGTVGQSEYSLALQSSRLKKILAIPKDKIGWSLPDGKIFIPLQSDTPVKNVLVAYVSLEKARVALRDFQVTSLFVAGLSILLGILAGWQLWRLLGRPLKGASQVVRAMQSEDFSKRFEYEKRTDEIGLLARTLNTVSKRLFEQRAEIQKDIQTLQEQNDILEKELKMGRAIQQGILPTGDSLSSPAGIHISYAATYEPLEYVSGDYYDFFTRDDGAIVMLVADASGHGIPAALVTILAKMTFSEMIPRITDTGELLEQANRHLAEAIVTSEYITVFYIVLHPDGQMEYCNGSHQKALLCRGEQIQELDSSGFFLGAMADLPVPYESEKTAYEAGDRIVLYSDGIIEAMNSDKEEFGMERFLSLIQSNASLSPQELNRLIMKEVEVFSGETPRFDDYTLVIVDIDQKPAEAERA